MKRLLIISLVIALVLCAAGCYINYREYNDRHYLKWSVKHHGGEITIEHGFGWRSVHIYGMSPEDHDSHKLEFSVFSLLLTLTALFVVCLLICLVVSAVLKLRKH